MEDWFEGMTQWEPVGGGMAGRRCGHLHESAADARRECGRSFAGIGHFGRTDDGTEQLIEELPPMADIRDG